MTKERLEAFLQQTANDYDISIDNVKYIYEIHGSNNFYSALEEYLVERRQSN